MSIAIPNARSVFNPADVGTSEAEWSVALEQVPLLVIPEGRALVVIGPHPDDEVLGAGGLIWRAAKAGKSIVILSVTDGEAAYPDWAALRRIRRRELTDAMAVLSARELSIERLGIPDGTVTRHRAILLNSIERQILGPTLLVAPYEHDGHPDHEAAAEVCLEITDSRDEVLLWRYPIWAWHHYTPEDFRHSALGRLDLSPTARDAKGRAMTCFASQLSPWGRDPIVPAHMIAHFTRPYEVFAT
jgi:LmbE family N-acetylglucosaminyl deacetylase